MKTESFPVGLSLTVSSHTRSTLSNTIAEQLISKLLSQRSVQLKYFLSPLTYFKSFWYMGCILFLAVHWKYKLSGTFSSGYSPRVDVTVWRNVMYVVTQERRSIVEPQWGNIIVNPNWGNQRGIPKK